jgi:hypothetical protein
MRIPFDNLGRIGAVADLRAESLPAEAWSRLVNCDLREDGIARGEADQEIYGINIVASATAIQTIAVDPWFLFPVLEADLTYWVYAGQNKVYAAIPLNNRVALTRQTATSTTSITSTSPEKNYSATANSLWSGAILAGVPLLNVDTAPPQYWLPVSQSQRLQELDWDKSASTKWSTRTAGVASCQTLRAYREYAIALGMEEDGVSYPRRLRWSHPAPPETTPFSWDETKPAYDAGIRDFEETGDKLVDCAVLDQTNFIYKEEHTWVMRWIGGRNIFQFYPRFRFGLFAPGCVGTLQNRHFVLTGSHMLVHDGTSYQDIGSERWERTLFNSIDSTYYRRTFVFTNEYKGASEVWVCYPEQGSEWATMALVWDYRRNTFHQRELKGLSMIGAGRIDTQVAETWSSDVQSWDEDATSWNDVPADARQLDIVGASPDTATLSKRLWRLRSGYENTLHGLQSGEIIDTGYGTWRSLYERIGLPIMGKSRGGGVKGDSVMPRYIINELWPHFRGADGAQVSIKVGVQETLKDAVVWSSAHTFTVGTDLFVELYLEGRLVSVNFETEHKGDLVLLGFDLEVDPAGRF